MSDDIDLPVKASDPIEYLLSLPRVLNGLNKDKTLSKIIVLSDFVPTGIISSWINKKTSPNGVLDIQFPSINWNEVVNSLSTTAVLEFQGWVRSTTYAATTGVYVVSCQGSHTVYIRNANNTHVLSADVYSGGGVDNGIPNINNNAATSIIQSRVISSVFLKIGLVGIVMPIRGVAKSSCSCTIKSITSSTTPTTLNLNSRVKPADKSVTSDNAVISNSGRYTDSVKLTSSLSASIISNSFTSIVPHVLKYIPEVLKWEYKSINRNGINKAKSTGVGLLLRYYMYLHMLIQQCIIFLYVL